MITLQIAAMPPEGQLEMAWHQHQQMIVEQLVFLGDDHQIGAAQVTRRRLPAEPAAGQIMRGEDASPGQFSAILFFFFGGRALPYQQIQLQSAFGQHFAQGLEKRDTIMRQAALDDDDAFHAAPWSGCRTASGFLRRILPATNLK